MTAVEHPHSAGRAGRVLPQVRIGVTGQKVLLNLAILAVIWISLSLLHPRFLTPENISNVARQIATVVVVASVVTLLMISRNFDLSVGGVVALSGCLAATLAGSGWPLLPAFVAATLAGTVVGIGNGFLVVVVGINSVIATLGTLYLTRGSALLVTGGVPVYSVPDDYEFIGAGYLGPIPIPVTLMVLFLVVMTVIERRSWLGKYARATGSNAVAARLAGVPTRRVQMLLFAMAGTAAGFGGVMTGSRVGGGIPTVAEGLEFAVVVAAVLGGTSLAGGEGVVIGTFLGALLVGTVDNGLNLLGVPTFWQLVALGIVLVLAVLLDAALRRRGRRVGGGEQRPGPAPGPPAEFERRAVTKPIPEPVAPALALEHIHKSFGGVQALTDAWLEVRAGEVHALLGENGAGKSTIVKIVAGVHERDAGVLRWQGQPVEIRSVAEAERMGIRIIYQQLNVIDHLTVAENLTLGRERIRWSMVDVGEGGRRATEALAALGIELDVNVPAGSLRVAEKQLIEIARALWGDVRLLIMDEPTSSLGEREVDRLFEIIGLLRSRGIAVVYISHKLEEVFRIADRVTVLRDGRTVGSVATSDTGHDDLIAMMVGRRLGHEIAKSSHAKERVVLRVESLTTDTGLHRISFSLREGEVLGVYGLLGSGRTELARALFGADPIREGSISIDGKAVRFGSPADAKRVGMGLVTEDRAEASFPLLTIKENLTAPSWDRIAPRGWLRPARERSLAQSMVDALRIRTQSVEEPLTRLSGGNQQKVVVGRWLLRAVPILILDDPTSGIDVGAKDELYHLIGEMTATGTSVIMTSSELPELIALSDRIAVLHHGRLVGTLQADELTQANVIRMAVSGERRRSPSGPGERDAATVAVAGARRARPA